MQKLTDHIRGAAFDLDGTLVDSALDLAAALNHTLASLGASALPEPRVRALIGHGVERLVSRGIAESLGGRAVNETELPRALAIFRAFYGRNLFRRSRLYSGVVEALEGLARAGIDLCCITNKDAAFAEPLLEAAGLRQLLRFSLSPRDPAERKPDAHMLLAACARLGSPPSRLLYVGDSTIDLLAARAAGCPVARVTYGYDSQATPAGLEPDWRVDNLTELLTVSLREPTRS